MMRFPVTGWRLSEVMSRTSVMASASPYALPLSVLDYGKNGVMKRAVGSACSQPRVVNSAGFGFDSRTLQPPTAASPLCNPGAVAGLVVWPHPTYNEVVDNPGCNRSP